MGVGGQRQTPAALPHGKRLGSLYISGCLGPGQVWMGMENLTHLGIRTPGRPARSKLLYRVRYPDLLLTSRIFLIFNISHAMKPLL
jgi:hypothetical protein